MRSKCEKIVSNRRHSPPQRHETASACRWCCRWRCRSGCWLLLPYCCKHVTWLNFYLKQAHDIYTCSLNNKLAMLRKLPNPSLSSPTTKMYWTSTKNMSANKLILWREMWYLKAHSIRILIWCLGSTLLLASDSFSEESFLINHVSGRMTMNFWQINFFSGRIATFQPGRNVGLQMRVKLANDGFQLFRGEIINYFMRQSISQLCSASQNTMLHSGLRFICCYSCKN